MSDCFDHEADAYDDLLFGQSSEELGEQLTYTTNQSQTNKKWYNKSNNRKSKGYINISLQGEKNGYRGE